MVASVTVSAVARLFAVLTAMVFTACTGTRTLIPGACAIRSLYAIYSRAGGTVRAVRPAAGTLPKPAADLA